MKLVAAARVATGFLPLSAGVLAVAAACTTFPTALAEFDSVSRRESAEVEPESIDYIDEPRRMPWALRQIEGLGVDNVLANVLGIDPEPTPVENPSGFARERLRILVERCGDDLDRNAAVAARALWVADLDSYPLNQIEAIKAIGSLLERQGMNPLQAPKPDPERITHAAVTAWLQTIETGWPGARPQSSLPPEQRAAYARALAEITELPLPSPVEQRALVRAMRRGYQLENDRALQGPALAALRAAMFHALSAGLLRALESPHPDVREAVMRTARRLGGAPAVAFVLARIAKPSSIARDPVERFDAAPQVRRTLVRMCGQLSEQQARESHEGGPAAVEFLFETVSGDPDEGLRLIALEALAHCLGRPVSFDVRWAREWWLGYVTGRGGPS